MYNEFLQIPSFEYFRFIFKFSQHSKPSLFNTHECSNKCLIVKDILRTILNLLMNRIFTVVVLIVSHVDICIKIYMGNGSNHSICIKIFSYGHGIKSMCSVW